jgi:hypothetical protein
MYAQTRAYVFSSTSSAIRSMISSSSNRSTASGSALCPNKKTAHLRHLSPSLFPRPLPVCPLHLPLERSILHRARLPDGHIRASRSLVQIVEMTQERGRQRGDGNAVYREVACQSMSWLRRTIYLQRDSAKPISILCCGTCISIYLVLGRWPCLVQGLQIGVMRSKKLQRLGTEVIDDVDVRIKVRRVSSTGRWRLVLGSWKCLSA